MNESKYIDYETYKKNSRIEELPWDEVMDGILLGWEKEWVYSPNKLDLV